MCKGLRGLDVVVQRLGWWVLMWGLVAVTMTACSGTQEALGLGKRTPDEFAVYTRAPLSLPPDYGLRPPEPGSSRPSAVMPRDHARQAVVGGSLRPFSTGQTSGVSSSSAGTEAILERTGAFSADPDIRQLVNAETSILAEEDQSFTERLMFWSSPTAYGTVVDPTEETKRIRENQALGRSITAGNTPTIERKRKALLEGIFSF